MVDIIPRRRLVVPLFPPRFKDLVDVSDFVSPYFQDFGVVAVGEGMLSSVPTLVSMCRSLGLRLLVVCHDPDSSSQASEYGAHLVTVRPDAVRLVAVRRPETKLLVSVSSDMDLEFAKVSGPDGVYCPQPLVPAACRSLPEDAVVVSSGGDLYVQAVKDGADLVVVPDSVFSEKEPGKALRRMAEEFREHT